LDILLTPFLIEKREFPAIQRTAYGLYVYAEMVCDIGHFHSFCTHCMCAPEAVKPYAALSCFGCIQHVLLMRT